MPYNPYARRVVDVDGSDGDKFFSPQDVGFSQSGAEPNVGHSSDKHADEKKLLDPGFDEFYPDNWHEEHQDPHTIQ